MTGGTPLPEGLHTRHVCHSGVSPRSLINIHILVKFQSLITSLLSPQYIYHICDAIAIITYSKTQLTADLFVNLIPHFRHISFNTGMVKIGRLFISTSLFLIKSANT